MATKPTPVVSKIAAKKELSTNNFIAAVIAVTLIVVIICGLIAKGMAGSLIVNTKIIAGKVTAKNDLDTKLANIPTLLQNYQNLGNAKQLIADGLPNDSDFPQIISIMQGIGTASAVNVKDISPASEVAAASSASTAPTTPSPSGSSTQAPGSPTPYVFSTSVTAPYAQLVNFFHDLEISDRPIHVTSAHFSGTNSSITADLTLQTYYQGKANVDDTTEAIK